MSFKAGEVVRLKSGGPKMTVTQVGKKAMTGESAVWCVWFEGTKKHEDTFAPEALEAVNGGGGTPRVVMTKPKA
jgi:uncharacterized protein YodC (DUF2158 family)